LASIHEMSYLHADSQPKLEAQPPDTIRRKLSCLSPGTLQNHHSRCVESEMALHLVVLRVGIQPYATKYSQFY